MASRDLSLLSRILKKKTTSLLPLEENPVTTSLSKGFIGWKTVIERRGAEDYYPEPGRVRDSACSTRMILGTTKGTANIPEEAVKVSKEEALEHQRHLIDSWPSVTEVFFLRFGRYIAAASTFACSAACINAFHPILKFGRGTITGVIPSILIPTGLVFYKVDKVLTDDILTLKMSCPLCYHFKYLALQLYGSIGFPGLMGILSTNAGYNVSYNKIDTREYWKKTFEIAKTKTHIFSRILFVQITLAFTIPYMQNSEMTKIMKELTENPWEESLEKVS